MEKLVTELRQKVLNRKPENTESDKLKDKTLLSVTDKSLMERCLRKADLGVQKEIICRAAVPPKQKSGLHCILNQQHQFLC